jgi:transposase-like protein
MSKKVTDRMREEIVHDHRGGVSQNALARQHGLHRKTIYTILQEKGELPSQANPPVTEVERTMLNKLAARGINTPTKLTRALNGTGAGRSRARVAA